MVTRVPDTPVARAYAAVAEAVLTTRGDPSARRALSHQEARAPGHEVDTRWGEGLPVLPPPVAWGAAGPTSRPATASSLSARTSSLPRVLAAYRRLTTRPEHGNTGHRHATYSSAPGLLRAY